MLEVLLGGLGFQSFGGGKACVPVVPSLGKSSDNKLGQLL